MLKRIQALRNIGRFKNCKPGNVEFGRLTLIYGRNTYGKSTLGDVFASIQSGNCDLVTGRMTIPHDGRPQHICLSLHPSSGAKEVPVTFDMGTWTTGLPAGIGIKTFDDGFIHRNVFLGKRFSRDTKESFSAFVLGEQGVQQARLIGEKKQARHSAVRDRGQLERTVFKDVGPLQSFLALPPTGTLEESDARLHSLRNAHASTRKQLEQIQAIQARDEGVALPEQHLLRDSILELNDALGSSLEGAHEDAKQKVAQHIANAFKESQGAELWIRQGARQSNGEVCQFCGQALTDDAHSLLELYRQAFDDAFDRHDTAVKQRLAKALAQVNNFPVDGIRVALAKNAAIFGSYRELDANPSYSSAVGNVTTVAERIEATLAAISNELTAALTRMRLAAETKERRPHVIISPIDVPQLLTLEAELQQLVVDYNGWIERCNVETAKFKAATNLAALQKRLHEIEEEGKAERRNNDRIRLHPHCDTYAALQAQVSSLEAEIQSLEKKLEADQSTYLEQFFESLNGWFKRFGSNDFTLERGETRQGHTPIYFPKVKYKGHVISEAALSQVFSESDRRALALAIFWTQLQSLPESIVAQQIIVLDDPITSFDDHRITAVHRELVAAVEKVRQIIILSHYKHDIQLFLETFKDHPHIALLSLVADGANGTAIHRGDPNEFLLTKHQVALERMIAFRDGHTNNHSTGDLRVFFEAELNGRFAAQIVRHELLSLQLGDKIDKLCECDVISDDVRQLCHHWRQVLNPSHHTWSSADLEDHRVTVRDFLEFVFDRLIRKQ